MKSINEYIGQELQWVHPNPLSSEYELRAGDELLARLHWNRGFTSRVHAETVDSNWVIECKGIRQTITALALDAQAELATIKRGMSGQATFLFADGREYRWQCTSFWRDVWTWVSNEGTPLLHLKRGAHVHLEPAAQDLSDLALLTTLGWYLHKQQEEEAALAAIVPFVG